MLSRIPRIVPWRAGQPAILRRPLAALLVGTAVLAWSASTATARNDRIVISGSSTVAPLVADIGKRFERLHPGVRVDVQSGGSSRGIQDVRRGLADIGMVSRDPTAAEADLRAQAIARDGIGIIVHADNRIDALRSDDVIAIFRGEKQDWSELGGPPTPITVVHKAEGRSTLELFLEHFAIARRDVRAHVVIGDNQHGIKAVAGSRGAVGYVSIGTAEFEARLGVPIRLVAIDGVAATTENVRLGVYPLARTLHLMTALEPVPQTRAFLAFASSEAVADIVRDHAFVALP